MAKPCPKCDGDGTVAGFVDGPHVHEFRTGMTCRTCLGTGKISDDFATRIAAGKILREDRVKRMVSGPEEAKRFGLEPIAYNHIEQGRYGMPPAVAAHYATLVSPATGGTPDEI